MHRVVLSQLLLVVIALELLRPERADPSLSIFSRLIQFGIVIDCFATLTLHLRRMSTSDSSLAFVLRNVPLLTDTAFELATAVLMLGDTSPSIANDFLSGSLFVKPMAMGALGLMLSRSSSGVAGTDSTIFWLLSTSGVIMLAARPHLESRLMHAISKA